MEFYTSTEAKQYARNKTRIIKEINDIEQTIAEAVDNNQFSCVVENTYMTDTRETVEPNKDATAHCIMQLSKVTVLPNELEQKDYFRVGEVLALKDTDKNSVQNPLEFRIKEVNENGDIIDLEIVSRGEYDGEIFEEADLQYKDMTNWLDIDSNYGLVSDLQIDREGKITVKDYVDSEGDRVETNWFDVNNIYDVKTLPDEAFGEIGDAYIIEDNVVFFKTPEWLGRNRLYVYTDWKMPYTYGEENTVIYNVFGDAWVKSSHCGWHKVGKINDLGEIGEDDIDEALYNVYDIIKYTRDGVEHKEYKCCDRCLSPIEKELDWSEKPTNDFGDDLDMFIYPEGNYRVKINGEWIISPTHYRFDQLYLEDDFGEVHDVITYTGELEPYTTYIKLDKTSEFPKGHWVRVDKVWDLDKLLLGRLPVKATFEWTIKQVIMDDIGDGYVYDTSVLFSSGNATALPVIVNGKMVDIKLVYGGDDYTDTIPEVSFRMNAPSMGKKYFEVWKQVATDYVLQDEMNQVMEYFNGSRKYTITRVTNDNTGNSFVWVISWY